MQSESVAPRAISGEQRRQAMLQVLDGAREVLHGLARATSHVGAEIDAARAEIDAARWEASQGA